MSSPRRDSLGTRTTGRQARSEATRRKIINAAVELFNEIGYSATGLGDVIERAEMTKGALYYHFDSKESLATAIIDEGTGAAMDAFDRIRESSSPALENMIHGVFVATDVVAGDRVAYAARHVARALGEFNEVASRTYRRWAAAMSALARQAKAEGDLRGHLDPDAVADLITGSMLGAELISNAMTDGDDPRLRLARTWEILLPAIVTDDSLPYFREFLARESLRHLGPPLSIQ
jgi:AcrR family transcriptional regulator